MAGQTIRNREAEVTIFRARIIVASLAVLLCFCILAARMVYLQVVKREHYHVLAEANRISLLPVAPNRGIIYDRNGEVLAANYSAYTLRVTPSKVKNLEAAFDQLATVIDLQPSHRRRFKRLLEDSKNFESLPIRNRLSEVEIARFAVNRYRFPGFEISAGLFRNYPFGEIASHAIGHIGRINDVDLKRIEAMGRMSNYKGTDHIGKLGIERSYESELHGKTGSEQVEIDAGGRAIRSLAKAEPTSGNNLTLTLDIRLQKIAEQAFGELRGALVALDPRSGEVLALVSKPGFDPNLFVDGIDPINWDLLVNSPDKPLLNRSIREVYPPGSTLKPFLALAALESGKRTTTQGIADPGFFVLPNESHVWRDDVKGGHGWVDMHRSIVASCDTYYYQLAADTDIDKTAEFLATFGFGARTGIDIGGEVEGVLPSRAWKEKQFAKSPPAERKWYQGESISTGIGQGANAYTPMQLAHAIAALANDGVAYRPRLVKRVTDAASGAVRPTQAVIDGQRALQPAHIEFIKNALVGVTREAGGTGARAFANASYVSAGKTGTAQVYGLKGEKYESSRIAERLRDHAWYVAYAPADKPLIALAVVVENGGFGGSAAAPIVREVLDYFLLGKLPEPRKPTPQ